MSLKFLQQSLVSEEMALNRHSDGAGDGPSISKVTQRELNDVLQERVAEKDRLISDLIMEKNRLLGIIENQTEYIKALPAPKMAETLQRQQLSRWQALRLALLGR